MLTLYYSPGACSMASHIGLEECGAAYTGHPVLIAKGEQKTAEYAKINPRGKVPALAVDGRIIVENTAILSYLARRYPEAKLLPADPVDEANCIGTMAWFSNTVHPSYQRYVRTERFAEGEVAIASVKDMGKKSFWSNLEEIDSLLTGRQWVMGDQFTAADGYCLVFYGWGLRAELPMSGLANYSAFKDRMLKRPKVMKVLQNEQSVLLK
jgi:glutathione S-transferase